MPGLAEYETAARELADVAELAEAQREEEKRHVASHLSAIVAARAEEELDLVDLFSFTSRTRFGGIR
jgi:hypothetical protein